MHELLVINCSYTPFSDDTIAAIKKVFAGFSKHSKLFSGWSCSILVLLLMLLLLLLLCCCRNTFITSFFEWLFFLEHKHTKKSLKRKPWSFIWVTFGHKIICKGHSLTERRINLNKMIFFKIILHRKVIRICEL